jgi:hypothetical protein
LGELAIKYKEIIACENNSTFILFVILLSQVVLGQNKVLKIHGKNKFGSGSVGCV